MSTLYIKGFIEGKEKPIFEYHSSYIPRTGEYISAKNKELLVSKVTHMIGENLEIHLLIIPPSQIKVNSVPVVTNDVTFSDKYWDDL